MKRVFFVRLGLLPLLFGPSPLWCSRTCTFPSACRAVNNPSALRALHSGTVRPVLIATTVTSAAVAALAPFILEVLYSPEFEQAQFALALMAVATVFRTWTSVNSFFVFCTRAPESVSAV